MSVSERWFRYALFISYNRNKSLNLQVSHFNGMIRQDAEKRILELRDRLEVANRSYYVDNSPVISDRDCDFLMK